MGKPSSNVTAAMAACLTHARDLLESAEAVQSIGHPHIAYHLATLSLEELGRRELFVLQTIATDHDDPPPWLAKATTDHVKKLFWCFYSLTSIDKLVEQAHFFELLRSASAIHMTRLTGLYVDEAGDHLQAPSDAISAEQGQQQIEIANTFLQAAVLRNPTFEIPEETRGLQMWLFAAFDNPEQRTRILTQGVLDKLKEMQDVVAWTRWLREELERDDAKMRELLAREIRRGGVGRQESDLVKDKWRVHFRVETQSHSIRPAVLKTWNVSAPWLRLSSVQGERRKKELTVELTLGENVPIQGVWDFSLGIANHLIIALNMAMSGFWWWVLPRHKTRFYDKIYDLQNRCELKIERPEFQVFRGPAPALTEVHINAIKQCFLALPGPTEEHRMAPYRSYISGLMFASLVDVHWSCEGLAFGNFLQSLKLIMIEAGYSEISETPREAIGRLLSEKYPQLDRDRCSNLLTLVDAFDGGVAQESKVELCDVYLMKLFAEGLFRERIVPAVLRKRLEGRSQER